MYIIRLQLSTIMVRVRLLYRLVYNSTWERRICVGYAGRTVQRVESTMTNIIATSAPFLQIEAKEQRPKTMDTTWTKILPSRSDDADEPTWMTILFVMLLVPMVCLMPFMAFRMLQEVGRIKFSMEPVVYTGLDLAADNNPAVPPSFNVTLRAKSTYGLKKLCSGGRPAMEVSYSGLNIAMADVEPFCIEPRGEKVITATATTGWSVLPVVLRESMESDRRHGGVHLEVCFSFEDEEETVGVVPHDAG